MALLPLRRLWANRVVMLAASAVLLINLQDVTTSLSDTIWHTLLGLRPLQGNLGELAALAGNCWHTLAGKGLLCWLLLTAAVPWGAYYGTRLVRGFFALPIPRPALIAIGAALLLQGVCVVSKTEIYPMSPVAMFAKAKPPYLDRYYVRESADGKLVGIEDFLLETPQGETTFNLFREGDVVFARQHVIDVDMKTSWVLRKFSAKPETREIVNGQLVERGHPSLQPVVLRIDLHTGETEPLLAGAQQPQIATSRPGARNE